MPRFAPALAVLTLTLLVSSGTAEAKQLAGVPDGRFDEWRGAKLGRKDASGDGPAGGLDLGRLWLGDDGEALYLRLEVGRETILQNPPEGDAGNDLRLYLDLDNKRGTGLPVGALGVDLEVRFGGRSVRRYDARGHETLVSPGTGSALGMPTHSSSQFEIRIELPEAFRPVEGAKRRKKIRLFLEEAVPGGDRLPASGAVRYKFARTRPDEPAPIPLARAKGTDLRLLSLNVEETPDNRIEVFRRILKAAKPDVIAFQELEGWNASRAREFVEGVLGGAWSAQQQFDVITVSRFPIVSWSPVDGNLVTHIDLPNRMGRDLVLFNMHPPCCDNEVERDREFDNLATTWRDLLDGSGPFSIDAEDAAIFAGDYNLVGFTRQLRAIRDGILTDPGKGPNFAPGRAEGSLRDEPLRHSHRRMAYTWRRASSRFAPGRLDLVLYTGDALARERGFVLDTKFLPGKALRQAGLNRPDSDRASDHLALVVDFSVR